MKQTGKNRSQTPPLQHYVLSIALGTAHLHAYLMTTEKSDTERMGQELLEKAEAIGKANNMRVLSIILCTGPLDHPTTEKIRSALCAADTAVAKAMQKATTIHRTIVFAPKGDPIDKMIMDLH